MKSSRITTALKLALTIGAFYLLLSHSVTLEDGRVAPIGRVIGERIGELDMRVFVPLVALAALLKMVGIASSMARWHILLKAQGIRFNFGHLAGSFLIGRFLGTFLPSTVGLDGYKIYDVARFTKRVVEPSTATIVEKILGMVGIFLTFLVALPLGYRILGAHAGLVVGLTVPLALLVIAALVLLIVRPEIVLTRLPKRLKIEQYTARITQSAAVYQNKKTLLLQVCALSFLVHFCTAAMYFFTARAVNAMDASFWEVTFASSMQIFATVMSPLTIAGEGVREIVQALLLAKRIGVADSVLSAALGFWCAEALTLVGGVIWWWRGKSYQPKMVQVAID